MPLSIIVGFNHNYNNFNVVRHTGIEIQYICEKYVHLIFFTKPNKVIIAYHIKKRIKNSL